MVHSRDKFAGGCNIWKIPQTSPCGQTFKKQDKNGNFFHHMSRALLLWPNGSTNSANKKYNSRQIIFKSYKWCPLEAAIGASKQNKSYAFLKKKNSCEFEHSRFKGCNMQDRSYLVFEKSKRHPRFHYLASLF